jgi:hypothetical protein
MLDQAQNGMPGSLYGCNSSGLETANLESCTGATIKPISFDTSEDLQHLFWSQLDSAPATQGTTEEQDNDTNIGDC